MTPRTAESSTSTTDLLRDHRAEFASTDKALAAVDFERNGYTADWSDRAERGTAHRVDPSGAADGRLCEDDPALAAQLARTSGTLPDGTLGRRRASTSIRRARIRLPRIAPGSAPPLLAQHDWVHVLAGYGTKVEAELEVFAFIARANDDPAWLLAVGHGRSPCSRPGTWRPMVRACSRRSRASCRATA